jgi:GNAT superfamily N-acetyltransferase
MVSNELNSIDLVKTLELGEMAAMLDFLDAAPENLKKSAGIEFHTDDSMLISIMSQTEVLIFNRVVGLGLDDNVTESELDEIIARFKAAGAKRFFVQLSPIAIQRGVQDILSSKGFYHHNNWIRLYRNTEPIMKVHTDLQIRQIDSESASDFAEIVTMAFNWPAESIEWLAAMVGRPGWRHYMAFDGDLPVATGACFIYRDTAWIGFASTREDYRNRGAQSAILSQRIDDARMVGCTLMNVETAEQTPEWEAPSYRNMRRYGFEIAYIRPNYLLKL